MTTPGHAFVGDPRTSSVLRAALQLIQDGQEPSLRAIARHPGAPYHPFAYQQTLLAALAKEGFATLHAMLDARAHGSAEDQLRAVVGAYISFAMVHAGHYRVMFELPLTDTGDTEPEPLANLVFHSMPKTVAAATGARGTLRRTVNIWALVYGTAMLHLDGMVASLEPDAETTCFAQQVGPTALALALAPAVSS